MKYYNFISFKIKKSNYFDYVKNQTNLPMNCDMLKNYDNK